MGLIDRIDPEDGLMGIGIGTAFYGLLSNASNADQILSLGIIIMMLAFLLIFAEEAG